MKMVQIGQIIKFDQMILNDGKGCSNDTGKNSFRLLPFRLPPLRLLFYVSKFE